MKLDNSFKEIREKMDEHYKIRKIKSRVVISFSFLALVLALIPLFSVLLETIVRGAPVLSLSFIFDRIPPLGQPGGGIGPAIEGTLIIIGLTSLISIPIGVFSGVFLAEYNNNIYAYTIRFVSDVMTNVPSIVAGIFGWTLIVVTIGWSVLAGAVALSLIMVPVVIRTTEEAIRLVPTELKEAALALGIPKWKVTLYVVINTAERGIATGVLLSVARIAGETAPLLLTILGSRFWIASLTSPAAALPLLIFNFSQSPYASVDWPRAWGAALILILLVLSINIVVRYLTREKY